jgi:hypothetical protein
MILIKEITLQMISLYRWLSIAATTLSIRIMLLPVLVYQMKATARLTVSVFFPYHCIHLFLFLSFVSFQDFSCLQCERDGG